MKVNSNWLLFVEEEKIVWEFKFMDKQEWCRSGIRVGDLTIIATSLWDWERKGDGVFGNTWVSRDRILIVDRNKKVLWEHEFDSGMNIYSAEPVAKVANKHKGLYASSIHPFKQSWELR